MTQIPAQPQAVPALPIFPTGDVQLWLARLAELPCHTDWLDAPEQVRYQSISDPASAHQFAASRSFLRCLLAGYLQRAPHDVELTISKHGKPILATSPILHFNLSHSGEYLLLGLRRDAAIGVDIERHRPGTPIARIARRIFAPQQAAYFSQHPDDQIRFLKQWTALEARQKCLGNGIFNERADALTRYDNWSPETGYSAALAWPIHQPPKTIRYLTPSQDFVFDTPYSPPA